MNVQYYNAAMALVNAAPHIRQIDPEFATHLLDKAQSYKDYIVNRERSISYTHWR